MDEFLHRAQQVDVFCLAGAGKIGVVAGQCTDAVFFTSGKDNGIIWQQVIFFIKWTVSGRISVLSGSHSSNSKKGSGFFTKSTVSTLPDSLIDRGD